MAKLRQFLIESPAAKTFFSTIFPIGAGILSGTFVFEITTPAGLTWIMFYKSGSFYGLCILSGLIYWYNRETYLSEREAARFLDEDYCTAYMRSKCLPEAAERYKELIRNGVGGELQFAPTALR